MTSFGVARERAGIGAEEDVGRGCFGWTNWIGNLMNKGCGYASG